MYYKLGSFSGRLEPTSQLNAYYPQGLSAKVSSSPKPVFGIANTVVPQVPPSFALGSKQNLASMPVSPAVTAKSGPERVRQMQAWFKANENVPLYVIRGAPYRNLYYTTIALCVIGVGMASNSLYKLAF